MSSYFTALFRVLLYVLFLGEILWTWLMFWHQLQSFLKWCFCWTKSLTGFFKRCILSMQTEQKCRLCVYVCVYVRERETEREDKRERAAHKQGLQSILASINQLRKERVEFAYPPPVWEAEREKREGGRRGREELDPQPGVLTWMGKGERGGFSKEKKEKRFPEWIE